MHKKQLPSATYLHKRLDYNPVSGEFYWLGRYDGRKAGCFYKSNVTINLDDVLYLAHRIAWKMTYGEDPIDLIDHIDGNPHNNRINNLREATHAQNLHNMGISKRNQTGFKGVSQYGNQGKYRYEVMVNRKQVRKFGFVSPEDAYDEACKKREELHTDFARHK